MIQNQRTTRKNDDQKNIKNTGNFHDHLKNHHIHAIVVMLGFIIAQFFLMTFIVDASELTIQALLNCTNKIRLDHKVGNALVLNDQLNQAASNKLQDMAKYQYWAHQNPVTGMQPWDFIVQAGYNYETAGENLAYGFTDSQMVCDAWEKSPEHLANIVNTSFQDIGFAIDKANLHTTVKGMLVVQMFGSLPGEGFHGSADQTQQSFYSPTAGVPAPLNSPEVKGANTNSDSVYAAPMFMKNLILALIGFLFLCSFIAMMAVLSFKNNEKRVTMLKRAAIILFILALGILIYFLLNPAL